MTAPMTPCDRLTALLADAPEAGKALATLEAGLAAHADAWFARVKALFFAPKAERREDERPR